MGILTDANISLHTILIDNVFMNNGNPDASYWGHSIYLGSNNSSLVAIGNEICGTNIGHDIKSRAAINLIENNRLYDGAADTSLPSCNVGSASFALDLPNGGVAVVVANTMIRGTASQTSIVFAYGEEGLTYSTNSISFIDNAIGNTGANVTAIYDNPSTPIPVAGHGNIFASPIARQVNPASADQLTGSVSGSISADGTILTAPSSGSLATAAGTWSFGTTQMQPGQYQIFLNGSYVSGWAAKMEVDSGGKLYAYNSDGGGWWVWNNRWAQVAGP